MIGYMRWILCTLVLLVGCKASPPTPLSSLSPLSIEHKRGAERDDYTDSSSSFSYFESSDPNEGIIVVENHPIPSLELSPNAFRQVKKEIEESDKKWEE